MDFIRRSNYDFIARHLRLVPSLPLSQLLPNHLYGSTFEDHSREKETESYLGSKLNVMSVDESERVQDCT